MGTEELFFGYPFNMTKMTATSIYGKTPSKVFLYNLSANDRVAWYVVFGQSVHNNLFTLG